MSSAVSYSSVPGLQAELDGPVLRLTLDRAERRNAVNDTMLDAMVGHLAAAGTDEAVRVIRIDAAGPDFCAGSDLVANNAKSERKPRVGSTQRRLPNKANRLIPLLLETQVPIVAVVRGWAAGLGFHIALASDFCVAAEDARFWEPFMARGFTPDSGAAWLLPRLVGLVHTRRLLMLGEELSGTTAAEWGIIHGAHPDAELDSAAAELVDRLAGAPTVALGLTKWLLQSGNGLDLDRHLHNEAMALELSSRSEDFKEGLAAFRDKRNAQFKGR
ncbi:enoyl-CoA hydratase [Mycolicibacterium elephantis DSM 44368]|uniref:Enoyl-CoA hydratase n=1 Tax=Mycolicibacterium elephantis DSM 44368 TaxID=1335622 RepID=A0A439DNP0_9MYCO|nr:enoyl-CoA hydratase [Mycolicibacterium elephantis DSM 44368]